MLGNSKAMEQSKTGNKAGKITGIEKRHMGVRNVDKKTDPSF